MTTNVRQFEQAIKSIAKKLPADVVRTRQRLAGIDMFATAIRVSPVDTGRFRGNWQATVGTPASGTIATPDPSGTAAKSKARVVLGSLPDFAVVFMTNNLEYAAAIDLGLYEPANPRTDEEALKKRRARRKDRVRRRAAAVGGHQGAPLVKDGFLIQRPGGITPLVIEAGLASLRKS